MSGKVLTARAFEPPWGKRKVPAFVSKAGTYYGGEVGTVGGINTDHGDHLQKGKKKAPSLRTALKKQPCLSDAKAVIPMNVGLAVDNKPFIIRKNLRPLFSVTFDCPIITVKATP